MAPLENTEIGSRKCTAAETNILKSGSGFGMGNSRGWKNFEAWLLMVLLGRPHVEARNMLLESEGKVILVNDLAYSIIQHSYGLWERVSKNILPRRFLSKVFKSQPGFSLLHVVGYKHRLKK
jgi:hypothetical protein